MARILSLRDTGEGWHVLTVPHTVVPGYDFDEATLGMSEEEIRREILLDWLATSGVRVYPGFSEAVHVAKEPIRYDQSEPLYCGWDFGLCPAFGVTQLNSHGQWLVLSAIAPEEGSGLGTYEFGEMCADHLMRRYALPHARSLDQLGTMHFGDPAGAQKAVKPSESQVRDMKTHFAIIRDGIEILIGHNDRDEPVYERKPGWGWNIIPGEQRINKRIEAMRARMSFMVGHGLPAFLVSPDCPVAVEALSAYHYKVRADGRQELDPFKGWESHLVNALEYICTRLFYRPDEEEDEDTPKRIPFRSHAAGPEPTW